MERLTACKQDPPSTGVDDLFHTYADMVYRLAFLRTRSSADAEDVLQEVFVRCLRSRPRWTDAEHQKAWFIRVTLNCTKSLVTSAWRRHTASLESAPPDDDALLTEMREETAVYGAVLELPEQYRTVIHLHYYEGYGLREIAALTGSTEAAVKSRLFCARELLRQRLKGEEFDV